jgi:hypothetical protein
MYALLMFSNCLKMIKIETCRSYEKLGVRNIHVILRLVLLLVLLCELKTARLGWALVA